MTEHNNQTARALAAQTDAVILVGGKGTRLRPLTVNTPKPMLPTAGVPFLKHLLARIQAAGIKHVILSTSFKAEVFTEYFGDGNDLGLELEYVTEEVALGTGGGIRNVYEHLRNDRVMIFNGDVLGGADLGAMLQTHVDKHADVTMHLLRVPDPRAFGCVPTDENGIVQAFLEKTPNPPTDQINAGCYIFQRDIIGEIPANREISVEREVFPKLLEEGRTIAGHVDQSYWRDMGTPKDFVNGSSDLVRGIAPSPLLEGISGEFLVDPTAKVEDSTLLLGGTVVGANCSVASGCRLDESVLFEGVTVEPGAFIKDSIISAGAHIGANAVIEDAIIGEGAKVGARCELKNGMRVWPNVEIPEAGIRFSTDA
ncbi:MAG: NDP-sugar synthase [Corynebacterium sp.]|nr:NDP-sugar synthase [Corynebacterium sp.]